MKKLWDDNAWNEYLYWQTQDKKTLKKINRLLVDIDRNGYNCTGKPEPLRGNKSINITFCTPHSLIEVTTPVPSTKTGSFSFLATVVARYKEPAVAKKRRRKSTGREDRFGSMVPASPHPPAARSEIDVASAG